MSTETGQGTGFHFELPYVPALAPRRGDTPLQRAAHLLAPLPRMMQAFCEGHLGMEVELAATMQELSAEALFDFTAVVPLGGGLDATLGVSIERPLLLEMTRRFEPEFTAAEIPAMADSVGAEIANTLVGNATVYFTPIDRRVAMGTPEILGGEVRRVRFGRRVFRGFSGKAAAGGFMLFCVLPEETAS